MGKRGGGNKNRAEKHQEHLEPMRIPQTRRFLLAETAACTPLKAEWEGTSWLVRRRLKQLPRHQCNGFLSCNRWTTVRNLRIESSLLSETRMGRRAGNRWGRGREKE